MDEESLTVLGQIYEALGSVITEGMTTGGTGEDDPPTTVFNVTPEGVSFQGYTVEEIIKLESVVTRMITAFPETKNENKVGF